MIPYPYNMVDMGGIDLAEANGTIVPGIYAKILEAADACGDLLLYNWKFASIEISPQHTQIFFGDGKLLINSLIQVTELDEITVLGIEPPPPPIVPVIPLVATENRTYTAQPPASGFNPVTVNVESEGALAFIRIQYPEGKRCLIIKDGITYNAPDMSGEWLFSVKELGEYEVMCYITSTPEVQTVYAQYGKEYGLIFTSYITLDDIYSSIGAGSVNVVDGTVTLVNPRTFSVVLINKSIVSMEFEISQRPNFVTYVSEDGSYCYGYDNNLSGFIFSRGDNAYSAASSQVPQKSGALKASGKASAVIENDVMTITWEDSSILTLSPANCFGWWGSNGNTTVLWTNAIKN